MGQKGSKGWEVGRRAVNTIFRTSHSYHTSWVAVGVGSQSPPSLRSYRQLIVSRGKGTIFLSAIATLKVP